jgi:hypothetical protein
MNLELTERERTVLADLLEREIADLGPEIRHTDLRSYREDLKTRKQMLRELLEHLSAPQAA